ncbi:MAG: hypothetical protein KF856_10930 [Cyclobacteriaceae bacterium]|nr:hypothetical protein [Cyclobacteriaceae bacterium]
MMKKLKFWLKVIFIHVAGMSAIIFYESCCGNPDFPFYEVTSYDLHAIKTELSSQDTLKIFPVATAYRYFTHSGFFPNAYAWQCLSNGYEGPKFRYTTLNLISNKDFDDNHPAGTSLNDLFGLSSWDSSKTHSLAVPSPADSLMGSYFLYCVNRPIENFEHVLTVKINNENNTELTAAVKVNWK